MEENRGKNALFGGIEKMKFKKMVVPGDKLKLEVSIDCPLSLDGDGNELHLEDIIGTDKDIVPNNIEEKNNREIMLKCINNLKQRDKEIMVLRYGLLGSDEYTQKEVAEKLGISQSYISRIEKKVIKKLQAMINI